MTVGDRVIAPDRTYGTVQALGTDPRRVQVVWDDGSPPSWSLVELLHVATTSATKQKQGGA
jgi:hypothetical protein